ncbi:MAG: tetratricopeptide repeat protein [FCB group bacterium]|nr:tetratricopeptide repeat protein [FCB group bacterium]
MTEKYLQQTLDIPEIFQPEGELPPTMALNVIETNTRWTEFIAQLSQFGELDVPETKEQLESLLSSEGAPEKRAALMAGIARCEIGEGRFLEGAQLLGYAYSLLSNDQREARAFVLLEMVGFLAVIGSYDSALMILGTVKSLTRSEYLLKLANYYGLVNVGRKGDLSVVERLKASADYFKKNGQIATLAYHFKNIGNIFGKMGNYKETDIYYNKALELTAEPRYRHIKAALLHDVGMLKFRQGLPEKAIRYLEESAKTAESFYTRSYAIGNIGFIHFQRKEFALATDYFERSLDIANHYGVFHLVPGNCYYLANCYENLGKPELADHYFSKGAELSLELAQRKFPLKGERLRVIDAYIAFLKRNKTRPMSTYTQYEFSFAEGKPMGTIRAIFQKSLMDVVCHRAGSVQEAVKRLGMARRTWSKTQERVRGVSLNAIPESIQLFIQDNETLTWKEINRKFDDHLLAYLYHKNDMSKKKLSTQLGLNYSRLVTRFKEIDPSILTDRNVNRTLVKEDLS